MQYLGAVSKMTEWSWFISKANHKHHRNPGLCPKHLCHRSWIWLVLWRPTIPSRTNTYKRCPFHHRVLGCKSRKSRDTWNNRKIWPWSAKQSRTEANRVLSRERAGHSKYPCSTTQEKILHTDITQWSIPKSNWLYSLQPKLENLYILSKNKTRSWLWLR